MTVSPLEIVRAYNSGETVSSVAQKLRVNQARVSRVLRAVRIPIDRNRGRRLAPPVPPKIVLTDEQVQRIKSGAPVREIAAEIGVNVKTVYDAMTRQGVPALRTLAMGPLSDDAIKDWQTSPDSTAVVARRHGMAGPTFARKLRKQGLGRRPPLAVRRPMSMVTSAMLRAGRTTISVTVAQEIRRRVLEYAVEHEESVNGLIVRWIKDGLGR